MKLNNWYELLLKPKSQREAGQREFITDLILLITLCFLTILDIMLVIRMMQRHMVADTFSVYFFGGLYVAFIILYIVSRLTHQRLVPYLVVILYTFGVTYAAAHWGPDLYEVVASYALVITLSAIIVNASFSFFVALCISMITFGLNALEVHHVIGINHAWRSKNFDTDDALEMTVTYAMIACIAWLSNRELKHSLSQAEEIIKEKMEQLYRFAEFGRLSSGIFHDLLNPLSIIALDIERLSNSEPIKEELTADISRAIAASRRMDNLIVSVKKQISDDRCLSTFSVSEEIRKSIALLDHRLKKSLTRIELKEEKELFLYGSAVVFQRIMVNLLSNAIDASEMVCVDRRLIVLEIHTNTHEISLIVRDHGIGIKAELVEKIFDPFFTTKSEKGMGLGLSTTKQLVEKDFAGSIAVTSEEGQGTSFRIIFHHPTA